MRVGLVVVVVAGACVPVKVPVSSAEPAMPVSVRVSDSSAFARALQVAVGDGFQTRSVDAGSGVFVVERARFDEGATAARSEKTMGKRTGPAYFRRLTITVAIGAGLATVSPMVVLCVGNTCDPVLLPALAPDEADAVDRLLRALEPPVAIPARPTSDW